MNSSELLFVSIDTFEQVHCSECDLFSLCAGCRIQECAVEAGVVLEEE